MVNQDINEWLEYRYKCGDTAQYSREAAIMGGHIYISILTVMCTNDCIFHYILISAPLQIACSLKSLIRSLSALHGGTVLQVGRLIAR